MTAFASSEELPIPPARRCGADEACIMPGLFVRRLDAPHAAVRFVRQQPGAAWNEVRRRLLPDYQASIGVEHEFGSDVGR